MITNRYNYLTFFRSRRKREKRTHIKQWHHNQNTTSRKPKEQFLSPKLAKCLSKIKNVTRTYMQRHTMTEAVNHSKSTALERSIKILLGREGEGGLNRFYVATTLALSSAVVYTKHLFSSREGFMIHQCNISENIKKSNEYRDETTLWTRQQ